MAHYVCRCCGKPITDECGCIGPPISTDENRGERSDDEEVEWPPKDE